MRLRTIMLGCLALGVLVLALLTRPRLEPAAAESVRASSGSRVNAPETSLVRIGSGEHATHAFVAWPRGDGRAPVVLVAQEWWGLNGQIREVAQALAREGYVAVVPDLYHGRVTEDPMQAHELSRGVTDESAGRDLSAAVTWARAQSRAARSRIGIVGFCLGGGVALQYALHSADVAAVAMFYGAPETDAAKIARLRAPIQGHFGAEDQGIPVPRVEEFRAALAKGGKRAEVYVYPGAGHAFMHEGRPSFRVDAARQAWARLLGFLQKQLKSA